MFDSPPLSSFEKATLTMKDTKVVDLLTRGLVIGDAVVDSIKLFANETDMLFSHSLRVITHTAVVPPSKGVHRGLGCHHSSCRSTVLDFRTCELIGLLDNRFSPDDGVGLPSCGCPMKSTRNFCVYTENQSSLVGYLH